LTLLEGNRGCWDNLVPSKVLAPALKTVAPRWR